MAAMLRRSGGRGYQVREDQTVYGDERYDFDPDFDSDFLMGDHEDTEAKVPLELHSVSVFTAKRPPDHQRALKFGRESLSFACPKKSN